MKEILLGITFILTGFLGYQMGNLDGKRELKRQAIQHNKAEYFISNTNIGTTEWRWKE